MSKRMIAINGRFLARRQTGQERFAKEVVLELDKICGKNEFELVISNECKEDIKLKNIKIVKIGNHKSHLWEQTDFYFYCKKSNLETLNLCTIQPILLPGIVCIHDISYKINPDFFKTKYGRMSAIWHRLNYRVAVKHSRIIFTVTETSKQEIINEYNISPDRVIVVPNGWEHIRRVTPDSNALNKYPRLKEGNYFVTIGSLAPNKNIKWIIENAKVNPQYNYVVVGRASLKEYGYEFNDDLNNLVFTGYLSDEELTGLLIKSKALIFPSTYEGFGIPPLEALALGKDAIVANCSCMPSIFKSAVHYLDPENPNVKIDDLLATEVQGKEEVLSRCTYKNAANIIYNAITQ